MCFDLYWGTSPFHGPSPSWREVRLVAEIAQEGNVAAGWSGSALEFQGIGVAVTLMQSVQVLRTQYWKRRKRKKSHLMENYGKLWKTCSSLKTSTEILRWGGPFKRPSLSHEFCLRFWVAAANLWQHSSAHVGFVHLKGSACGGLHVPGQFFGKLVFLTPQHDYSTTSLFFWPLNLSGWPWLTPPLASCSLVVLLRPFHNAEQTGPMKGANRNATRAVSFLCVTQRENNHHSLEAPERLFLLRENFVQRYCFLFDGKPIDRQADFGAICGDARSPASF